MKFIIIILFLFVSHNVYSNGFGVGIGAYNFGTTYQNDEEGGSATFSFHPGLTFDAVFHLWNSHFFTPELGYVIHRKTDDEYGEQSKRTIFFLFDFGYGFNQRFVIRYGGGLFRTQISGEGGAVQVRNGATGYGTAYRPEETSTSYNITLDLGFDFNLGNNFNVKFESYVFSMLNSEARALYYSLSGHYFF